MIQAQRSPREFPKTPPILRGMNAATLSEIEEEYHDPPSPRPKLVQRLGTGIVRRKPGAPRRRRTVGSVPLEFDEGPPSDLIHLTGQGAVRFDEIAPNDAQIPVDDDLLGKVLDNATVG